MTSYPKTSSASNDENTFAQGAQPGAPAPQHSVYVQPSSMPHNPPVLNANAQLSPFAQPYTIPGQKWRRNVFMTVLHVIAAVGLFSLALGLLESYCYLNYRNILDPMLLCCVAALLMHSISSIALLIVSKMKDLKRIRRLITLSIAFASIGILMLFVNTIFAPLAPQHMVHAYCVNLSIFAGYLPVAAFYIMTIVAIGPENEAPRNALLPRYLA